MENKTLISRNTLSARWDLESSNTLINYENKGILTRNPNLPVPRYYMDEILKIEMLKDINPLSPLERRRMERKIERLEVENERLREKLNSVKVAIGI
ncbi:transcription factor [Clostridium senegalense]|uniref:transcription factor n=1 Tax=Clostridium senegalense TaxID=1465809 RepID=UPI001C0FD93C|nr:transcription factor [Clostridium senegalense]MBU5227816.1 transcription factor [Clostridium senegalense]